MRGVWTVLVLAALVASGPLVAAPARAAQPAGSVAYGVAADTGGGASALYGVRLLAEPARDLVAFATLEGTFAATFERSRHCSDLASGGFVCQRAGHSLVVDGAATFRYDAPGASLVGALSWASSRSSD